MSVYINIVFGEHENNIFKLIKVVKKEKESFFGQNGSV